MRVYHFTEQPYPDAWDKNPDSIRVVLPSKYLDPVKAADLYHEYLDAWQLCDEIGLDIFVNEHHSTATCMTIITGFNAASWRGATGFEHYPRARIS